MIVLIGQRERVNEQDDDDEADDHGANPEIGADFVALFGEGGGGVKPDRPAAAFQFAQTDSAGGGACDGLRLPGWRRGRSRR